MDDDEDDWSPHAADIGSIAQLTDTRYRRLRKPEPIGFVHFEKPDRGVLSTGEWNEKKGRHRKR